jgi:heavy metal sensor kinase
MSLKKNKRWFGTVASRLMFWYTLTCTLFAVVTFALAYMELKTHFMEGIHHQLTNELGELNMLYAQHGLEALEQEFVRETESEGINHIFFRLLDRNDQPTKISDISKWNELSFDRLDTIVPEGNEVVYQTIFSDEGAPVAQVAASKMYDGTTLQFGINLQATEELLEKLRRMFITFSVSILLISILSGWLIARRAISGMLRVTEAAMQIRKGNLEQRVPVGKEGQEVEELAVAFNEMLGRIQELIIELKEVSDNIAHDLRSPITRIRGMAETTLTGSQELETYRETAGSIIEETDQLADMINTMLEIAQAEAGELKLVHAPIHVAQLLEHATELFLPVAEEKQIELFCKDIDKSLMITGDLQLFQRVIANVLGNALKYTLPEGKVTLCAYAGTAGTYIEVRDTGIGMTQDELTRIFERFYRSEKSRSTQGNGLGLSLAQMIVRAHGGSLTVESIFGEGSTFTLFIPAH